MKYMYLLLAVEGAIIPYLFFGHFVFDQGFDLTEFAFQLFETSPAGGFTADLLVTSCVFWIWSYGEAKKLGIRRWWIFVVANLTIGLSFSLPFFLYLRQQKIDTVKPKSHSKREIGLPSTV